MKFKNYRNMLERPFIVYCDTESTLEKTGEVQGDKKKSMKIREHVTTSCCYYVVCNFDPSRNVLKTVEGKNRIQDMIVELKELSDKCIIEMKKNQDMFKNVTCCNICTTDFVEGDVKCRDHDHATGKYRGATSKM